ncbi:MAG: response regulator [archaeon]|nr:response regulator [archaeon]
MIHDSNIDLKDKYFTQLVENSPQLMVFYDKDGYIFYVNKAWEKFFQMKPEDVVGIYNIHKDPLFHKLGLKKYWDAIQDGGFIATHDFDYDAKEVGLPGQRLWLNGQFGSVLDEDNQIAFYYLEMKEVTERKKLEEIVYKNQKWDTLQIFSGGIAHDLNNILTSFSGSISLIKDIYLDAISQQFQDFQELFSSLEIGVNNATQLANQLLVFSKGNLPLKKYTSLAQIIRSSIDFISHGKKVQILCDISDDLWNIFADPAQISQVLQNLVLNSIQAMEDSGKITITSRNYKIDPSNSLGLNPGDYTRTVISDTGPGIPASIQSKIFEMYFSTKEDGIGLGLSVANSIVKRHNGCLELISSELGGATVVLLLPANSDVTLEIITQTQPENIICGKILILDDNANIRHMLKQMCTFLKLDYKICSKSAEALKSYSDALTNRIPFDFILTDLTLRDDIDGSAFFNKILQINNNARGIIMSGYSDSDVMANFSTYGFRNRLRKPFTFTEFKQVLFQTQ